MGNFVFAPINMTEYIDRFRLFLHARQFRAMHRDGQKLNFTDARYDVTHDTPVGASKKSWLVFDRSGALCLESKEVQLHMPKVRFLDKREYAGLSTVFLFLKCASNPSNRVQGYAVLDRPDQFFNFFKKLGHGGHRCNFARKTCTARRRTFSDWQNVEMFTVPTSGYGSLYA